MKAVIVGGGMSGLVSAMSMLDVSIDVELFEADEIFGGRVSSWIGQNGGETLNSTSRKPVGSQRC
jgi:monoamine oxidase